jgi:hypothetical protein
MFTQSNKTKTTMLEKYKYTGKHRKDNESLVPAYRTIQEARTTDGGIPVHAPARRQMAYSAVEDTPTPAEDTNTIPDLHRPLSTSERIDLAPSPSIALQEVVADKSHDPAQTIKNIDLALQHFDADDFSEDEKALLADIIVESSEEIIHRSAKELPANDFADPIALGTAIDALHELEADSNETEPILEGIVTVVENISDATKNADHIAKLSPEEADAFLKSIQEFEHLPPNHHEKLVALFDDGLRRITETRLAYHELRRDHIKKKPQPLEDIRRSVDRYHDKKLRRQRAMATAASNLDATGALPVVDEKNIA